MTHEYIIAPILALTQLSIALNIVCIVAYNRTNFFIEIIEETILCTKTKIEEDIRNNICKAIIILSYINQLDDTDKRKSIIIKTVNGCEDIKAIYSEERKNTFLEKIRLKCTPHCLSALFAYCTVYGIMFLLILLFLEYSWAQSVFRYFVPLSLLPVIVFIIVKGYIDKFMYKKIESTSNNTELKRRRKRFIQRLSVENAFWAILVISFISLLLPFMERVFVVFYVSDKLFLFLATFISYLSFLIYIVVFYLYSWRRKEIKKVFFQEGNEKMRLLEIDYGHIVKYNSKDESDDRCDDLYSS